jgi:hypothetical protein
LTSRPLAHSPGIFSVNDKKVGAGETARLASASRLFQRNKVASDNGHSMTHTQQQRKMAAGFSPSSHLSI